MKKTLLTSLFLGVVLTYAQATVLTISNNPDQPAMYNSIVAANNAAAAGDTLYIYGTPFLYPNTNITKSLTLIGTGQLSMLEGGYPSHVSFLTLIADFVSVYGLKLNGMELRSNVNDIIFENCLFSGYIDFDSEGYGEPGSSNLVNITIRNCIFSANSYIEGDNSVFHNMNIYNNIFAKGFYIRRFESNSSTQVSIYNNVFYTNDPNTPAGDALQTMNNVLIKNNIFYGRRPCNSCGGASMYNNLVHTSGAADFGGANGANNITAQDPLFVNYPIEDDGLFNAGDEVYDFTLQGGSPGIGAGFEGEDLGVNNTLNLKGTPFIPQITTYTISSSEVNPGDNINIIVQVKSAGIE